MNDAAGTRIRRPAHAAGSRLIRLVTAAVSHSATRGAIPRAVPLPGWPVVLPLAAYLLWWVLGVGDMIWLLAGGVMGYQWLGTRGLRLPAAVIVWLMFIVWCVASMSMLDSSGRMIGAGYRILIYGAAAAFAIQTYNARSSLPLIRVTGAMTWFLVCMTAGGYLAMAFPELVIRTPMAWVVPQGLASNELVGDMIVRRTTQWNPNFWEPQSPRPAAPFLYANTWGNVYSLVAPLALLHLWLVRASRWRWPVAGVIVASVVPAVATLNRGMFLGLGVVGAWVGVQCLRRGLIRPVVQAALVVPVAAVAWFFSPSGQNFEHRIETTNSTVDRALLYRMTFDGALSSPLFGHGAPSPSPYPWLPSVGTQGQFWTVLYSNGFVGAALFMGTFLAVLLVVWRRTDLVGAVLGGIVLATLVESLFYGMSTGIMVSMVALALLLRPDTVVSSTVVSSSGPRRSPARSTAIVRRSGRR